MTNPILLDIPDKIETERCLISIYDFEDGKEFFELLQANEQHLKEELPECRTLKSIEDAEVYVREKRVEWLSRKRLVPKLVEKVSGRMLGQLWIEPGWERMIFEIGYFIEEKSQGKGYVSEAVQQMIETLFNELGANRLEIHTKATNDRSIGVAERCGFKKEAHLRERGRTNQGEVVDMLIFGFLKREYDFR